MGRGMSSGAGAGAMSRRGIHGRHGTAPSGGDGSLVTLLWTGSDPTSRNTLVHGCSG